MPYNSKEFWEKWYKADKKERAKLITELPLMNGKSSIVVMVVAPDLNDYFEDLLEYLEDING